MAKAVTIRIDGEESLQAWLKSKPAKARRSIAVIVANRAALRVVPFLADGYGITVVQYYADLTIAALHCLIISRDRGYNIIASRTNPNLYS